MEALFWRLVHMSLSAGWLVLAVLALRAVMKKAPRRIVCLLWALVAVRLICPLSIESRVSLVPRPEAVLQSLQTQETAAQDAQPVPADETAAPSGPSRDFILSRVWLAGTCVMLGWALWSDLRLRRRVRVSIPQQGNIRICDEIDTPFVLGLFRPQIYLPSGLNPLQAVHVLSHERAHIARRDQWWKPLGFLLLSVYWFHPLLWAAYVLLCRDLELACDERAVSGLDRAGLAAYSEALLHCSSPHRGALVFPVAFGEVGVKSRVRAILRYKQPALRIVLLSAIVIAVAAVLFLTDRPAAALLLPEAPPAFEITDTHGREDDWTVLPGGQSARADETPAPTPSPTDGEDAPAASADAPAQSAARQTEAQATVQSTAEQPLRITGTPELSRTPSAYDDSSDQSDGDSAASSTFQRDLPAVSSGYTPHQQFGVDQEGNTLTIQINP